MNLTATVRRFRCDAVLWGRSIFTKRFARGRDSKKAGKQLLLCGLGIRTSTVPTQVSQPRSPLGWLQPSAGRQTHAGTHEAGEHRQYPNSQSSCSTANIARPTLRVHPTLTQPPSDAYRAPLTITR